jgi:hypothetical protein
MLFLPNADQIPMFLAYLDPGSGSLLLQVLIAGLLSSLFFLKSSFLMVRTSLSRVFKNNA